MTTRQFLLLFTIGLAATQVAWSQLPSGRVLDVDQRGGGAYVSLAAAAAEARPGDTIRIAKGSGPYRETLRIKVSGTPEAPIVVEGNGETVTGFEPLTNFREENGVWVCDLPVAFPCVLTYRGERLVQNDVSGQFTSYAKLSEDQRRLVLLPGTQREGWEISTRAVAVQILDVSHHIYRDLKASGARNDGFNLHGTGENLVFENIEGSQNLDEGFSAHDQIGCQIRQGTFRENDNGVLNIASSVLKAENLSISGNLGYGMAFFKCTADLRNVKVWDNGVAQIFFGTGAEIACTDVTAYEPSWTARPWKTYTESNAARMSKPIVITAKTVTGEPVLLPSSQSPHKLDSAKN